MIYCTFKRIYLKKVFFPKFQFESETWYNQYMQKTISSKYFIFRQNISQIYTDAIFRVNKQKYEAFSHTFLKHNTGPASLVNKLRKKKPFCSLFFWVNILTSFVWGRIYRFSAQIVLSFSHSTNICFQLHVTCYRGFMGRQGIRSSRVVFRTFLSYWHHSCDT